jgi:hypothetical protein
MWVSSQNLTKILTKILIKILKIKKMKIKQARKKPVEFSAAHLSLKLSRFTRLPLLSLPPLLPLLPYTESTSNPLSSSAPSASSCFFPCFFSFWGDDEDDEGDDDDDDDDDEDDGGVRMVPAPCAISAVVPLLPALLPPPWVKLLPDDDEDLGRPNKERLDTGSLWPLCLLPLPLLPLPLQHALQD